MTNMHRRTFLGAAGMTALTAGHAFSVAPDSPSVPLQRTGNGKCGRIRRCIRRDL